MDEVRAENPAGAHERGNLAGILSTGVPGLDEVLGGGLRRGSQVMLAGTPGSGKTILAAQIAFAAAREGRGALILTALAEPTDKFLLNLRGLHFFDAALVGREVQVLSLSQMVAEGLTAAGQEIVKAARAMRAQIVVVDGFRGLRELNEAENNTRYFLYDVGNMLGVFGITLIVTNEVDAHDSASFPEASVADVILGLESGTEEMHGRRSIEVIKVRGAAPLTGRHSLVITDAGEAVSPRLEARVAQRSPTTREATPSSTPNSTPADPAGQWNAAQRISIGVPSIDALLGGGLIRGTNALVLGGIGVGKTFLGLAFARAALQAGLRGLYFGFRETPEQLLATAHAFAWGDDLKRAIAAGTLRLVQRPPLELDADVVADHLLALIDEHDAQFLVFDGLLELERCLSVSQQQSRILGYCAALQEAMMVRGVTALFLRDALGSLLSLSAMEVPMAQVAGTVLWLGYVERHSTLHRILAILQTRHSVHDPTIQEFVITPPEGIRVLGPLDPDPASTTARNNPPRNHISRAPNTSTRGPVDNQEEAR